MKSTKFIIPNLLFAMFLVFSGCNKEEKDPPALRLVSKIEHYENDGNDVMLSEIVEYRYDKQNRISEMTVTGETGVNKVVFSYPSENIMVCGSITYMLNSDGTIASLSNGDQSMVTSTYSNGYLMKRDYYMEFETISMASTETYTWENGNITSMVIEQSYLTDPSWSISATLIFEYGSIQQKPCSIEFYLFTVSIPRGWYGKTVKNLPSKVITQSDFGSDVVTTYRYEIDDKGYPTKIFVQENEEEELRTVIEYEN